MLGAPFLVAVVPGIIILLFTWWFKKKNLSLSVRIIPGIIGIAGAIIMFYVSLVYIRGYEGAAYGILSFFIILFALIALVMALKPIDKHS